MTFMLVSSTFTSSRTVYMDQTCLASSEEQSGTASTHGAITAHLQCGLTFLLLSSGTNSLPEVGGYSVFCKKGQLTQLGVTGSTAQPNEMRDRHC